ncbi:MAG: L-lysine 6-transaminase [Deltaproteobacteria bacterium]|nr:L-lysine 6-transaminase [Deltaproteobacteria bacterium]
MMIRPEDVHPTLERSMLVDGYPFVFDIARSHGQYLHDARTGRDFLDFFTFFASRPLAFDHPRLLTPEYDARVLLAARTKPSNCDIYTQIYAEFVETFRNEALGEGMKYLFFISGGALAVENALKAAFDWKTRKNLAAGGVRAAVPGDQVLHFKHAFHGRSGYTLSLTNTADPRKTEHFPKFGWPRVSSPAVVFDGIGEPDIAETERAEAEALREIDEAYDRLGADRIAAIIIEPIQCEGGDRHFRPEFLTALRKIADERETLLVFDEVQVGMGSTGARWHYERLGVVPDIVSFAKRAQVGGIMAGPRLDEVDNVFKVGSRISSTFAGNLVDMVRSQRNLEVRRDEHLLENVRLRGDELLSELRDLAHRVPAVTAPRGTGLILAFDLPSREARRAFLQEVQAAGLILLPCGERSVRLRPAWDVSVADCRKAMDVIGDAAMRVL